MKCDKKDLLLYARHGPGLAARPGPWLSRWRRRFGAARPLCSCGKRSWSARSCWPRHCEIQELCRRYRRALCHRRRRGACPAKWTRTACTWAKTIWKPGNVRAHCWARTKFWACPLRPWNRRCWPEQRGADYLGVGAVFPTGSKADAQAVSYDTLKAICQAVKIPVVAIGGIGRRTMCKS